MGRSRCNSIIGKYKNSTVMRAGCRKTVAAAVQDLGKVSIARTSGTFANILAAASCFLVGVSMLVTARFLICLLMRTMTVCRGISCIVRQGSPVCMVVVHRSMGSYGKRCRNDKHTHDHDAHQLFHGHSIHGGAKYGNSGFLSSGFSDFQFSAESNPFR